MDGLDAKFSLSYIDQAPSSLNGQSRSRRTEVLNTSLMSPYIPKSSRRCLYHIKRVDGRSRRQKQNRLPSITGIDQWNTPVNGHNSPFVMFNNDELNQKVRNLSKIEDDNNNKRRNCGFLTTKMSQAEDVEGAGNKVFRIKVSNATVDKDIKGGARVKNLRYNRMRLCQMNVERKLNQFQFENVVDMMKKIGRNSPEFKNTNIHDLKNKSIQLEYDIDKLDLSASIKESDVLYTPLKQRHFHAFHKPCDLSLSGHKVSKSFHQNPQTLLKNDSCQIPSPQPSIKKQYKLISRTKNPSKVKLKTNLSPNHSDSHSKMFEYNKNGYHIRVSEINVKGLKNAFRDPMAIQKLVLSRKKDDDHTVDMSFFKYNARIC